MWQMSAQCSQACTDHPPPPCRREVLQRNCFQYGLKMHALTCQPFFRASSGTVLHFHKMCREIGLYRDVWIAAIASS